MESKKYSSSFKNFANSYFKNTFNLKYQNENFMIDSIRFKNFANYKDEQTFCFSTKSKIKTEKNNLIDWNSKNSKKYKKVSGIWGRNASGKTTFLEIIRFANEYFNYSMNIVNPKRLNKFEKSKIDFYSLSSSINSGLKHEKNYFSPDSAFGLIADESKSSFIEFKFDTKKGELFYRIDINSTKKKEQLFSDPFFYEIKESFWLKKNNGELENLWDSYEDNSFKIAPYLMQKSKKDDNLSIQDNNENNLMIWATFILFNYFTHLIFSFDYSVTSNADVENIKYFIAEFIEILYEERFKKPFSKMIKEEWIKIQKETEDMILIYINALDPSVEKIRLTLSEKNIFENKISANLDIVKDNGKTITFGCLSSGTLVFIALSLRLKMLLITSDREIPFFFFFDELGNNWHSNLTATFISLFEYGIFGENIYLIFTSHDPLVADELDNDSVYYINNQKTIERFDETRNDKKFSPDYLNETINKLDTNASFNDFDDYMDSFEE